ncbi:MAG: ABC transporter permease subunit [Proteobacteria bacterium]|nr:ABC transporter permease subunit [Pseudomonadota bacterium]
MRALFAISVETFLRLRRDRIFLPATMVGIGLLILSSLASYWGVEEFFKILFDLGSVTWLFTGSIVAIFWGNKIISDSRQEGSLEVQLASPVSRSAWILGKFFGLSAALFLLAIIFIIGWQGIYWGYGMGWMPKQDLAIYALLSLTWVIMGAVSILFASLASAAIALFCSIWMFICGLLSAPIMQALAPETPEQTRKIIEFLAGLWNLHLFNVANFGGTKNFLPAVELLSRAAYGIILVSFFMSLACLFFSRRDIIA